MHNLYMLDALRLCWNIKVFAIMFNLDWCAAGSRHYFRLLTVHVNPILHFIRQDCHKVNFSLLTAQFYFMVLCFSLYWATGTHWMVLSNMQN